MLEEDVYSNLKLYSSSPLSPAVSSKTRPSFNSEFSESNNEEQESQAILSLIGRADLTLPSKLIGKKKYFSSRKKAVCLMSKLRSEFGLTNQTMYLSVVLLDRIFSKVETYQEASTIGVFCLILAAKYLDDGYKAMLLEKTLSSKISSNYKSDEIYILKLLDYDLSTTTSYDFLVYLISQGVFENNESTEEKAIAYLNKLILSNFIIKLDALQVAVSVVQTCRKKCGLKKINNFSSFGLEKFTEKIEQGYLVFTNALIRKKEDKKNKKN